MAQFRIYICYNEEGDAAVNEDPSTAVAELITNYGGEQIRTIQLNVELPVLVPQTVEVNVPNDHKDVIVEVA